MAICARRKLFSPRRILVFALTLGFLVMLLNILQTNESNYLQTIPRCGCTRPIVYPLKSKDYLLNSTCSDTGTFYTPAQNVVAFSLYIRPLSTEVQTKIVSSYTEGINLNLQAMRRFYPNFTMRIYTDYRPHGPQDPLCKTICENPDLFLCHIHKTPLYGNQSEMYFMTWRFLPLGDPTVDIFMSRDLDSVISSRESAAVSDWLQLPEKKGIHVMRDKSVHNTEILGGLWGAKNSWLLNVEQLASGILLEAKKIRKTKGMDQVLLSRVVYRQRKQDILAHDSYFCMAFGKAMTRPFPTKREGPDKDGLVSDFVGNPAFGRGRYPFDKCPQQCRPRYGKDWEYC